VERSRSATTDMLPVYDQRRATGNAQPGKERRRMMERIVPRHNAAGPGRARRAIGPARVAGRPCPVPRPAVDSGPCPRPPLRARPRGATFAATGVRSAGAW
jgi:hypothetical protein